MYPKLINAQRRRGTQQLSPVWQSRREAKFQYGNCPTEIHRLRWQWEIYSGLLSRLGWSISSMARGYMVVWYAESYQRWSSGEQRRQYVKVRCLTGQALGRPNKTATD